MIEMIKSPTPVVEKTQWTAFLAGPMNGAPSWQAQAPKVAAQVGIENLTLLNPRKTDRFVTGGIHHLRRMAKYYGVENIHTSLEGCMTELKAWMERPRKEEEKIHHIPGPAFEPMDKLSRMIKSSTSRNETLMEHWNQTVAPGDTVYVDGDFGAEEWKPFLNGKIELKTK